ncbi:hypothetical protein [Prosthecobacter sp.]|uniref:hypothetical protein n=1 Tax=Prosthecobacter sp. TaxID=1965333 RepID=UPI003784D6B3
MKTASFFLCSAAIALFSVSCDKHSWEETKVLHEGTHKAHHSEGHGDAHDAKPAEHGEKKDK